MNIIRRILFYLFVLIYVIVCPLLIMYVLGHVINPDTQKVVGTGLIYISSLPPSASVYINNKLYPETTPTTIRNLPKGNYTIRLLSKNYQPFEKTVTVEEQKAVTLEWILLIPKEWKKEILSDRAYTELIPIEDTSLVLVRKGPLMKDISILKLYEGFQQALHTEAIISTKKVLPDPLFKDDSVYSKAKVLNIFTVKSSTVLVFQIVMNKQVLFFWRDLKSNDPIMIDISALFPQEPQQVLWDPGDEKNLFSLQENYINRLNIEDNALYPKIVHNVRSYAIFDKEIYTLLTDSIFLKWDYKGDRKETLLNGSSFLSSINEKGNIKITVLDKRTVLGMDRNGRLLMNQYPFEVPVQDIIGFYWDKKDEKPLIWTKDKIGSLDIVPVDLESSAPKDKAAMQWFVTERKNITQAFWAYQGSHILYTDSNAISIIEAATYGTSVETRIDDIKKGSRIYYSEITGKVYYLDAKTAKLVSIEVVSPLSIIADPVSEEINKLERKIE